MLQKLFGKLYELFGKVTKKGLLRFAIKRLPLYLCAAFVLLVWGVEGVVYTFMLFMAFFLGWTFKGVIAAYKDYRLTQRLNRIHFTAVEFDAMKRERDLAIAAFQNVTEKAARKVKAAAMPPTPSGPSQRATFGPDDIAEYMRQHGLEGET